MVKVYIFHCFHELKHTFFPWDASCSLDFKKLPVYANVSPKKVKRLTILLYSQLSVCFKRPDF